MLQVYLVIVLFFNSPKDTVFHLSPFHSFKNIHCQYLFMAMYIFSLFQNKEESKKIVSDLKRNGKGFLGGFHGKYVSSTVKAETFALH